LPAIGDCAHGAKKLVLPGQSNAACQKMPTIHSSVLSLGSGYSFSLLPIAEPQRFFSRKNRLELCIHGAMRSKDASGRHPLCTFAATPRICQPSRRKRAGRKANSPKNKRPPEVGGLRVLCEELRLVY
jgi:hypothetical protein